MRPYYAEYAKRAMRYYSIKIFEEVRLLPIVSFTSDAATMDVVNCENTEERIMFTAPLNYAIMTVLEMEDAANGTK
jgi:hypothetical protein